jgi:DNA-3-methyladenine glycosylase II
MYHRIGLGNWQGSFKRKGIILVGRILHSDACIAEGAAWLAAREPRFATVLARASQPMLRRRDDGFTALLDAIVGQQVSTAAARAIWARLVAAGLTDAAAILVADDEALRAAGLSRQKISYARALATADIDYGALRVAPEADVIATLTAVKGIGVWSAEIYAMFALGRADAFAAGDLALQLAARSLLDLPARPSAAQLRVLAEDWRPWRGVAARLLWAYYPTITLRQETP